MSPLKPVKGTLKRKPRRNPKLSPRKVKLDPGVSEKLGGTLFWGPYNKDPTI